MPNDRDTCSKCGEKSIVKGDISLRTSKTNELIMVFRQDHGVEKSVGKIQTPGIVPADVLFLDVGVGLLGVEVDVNMIFHKSLLSLVTH